MKFTSLAVIAALMATSQAKSLNQLRPLILAQDKPDDVPPITPPGLEGNENADFGLLNAEENGGDLGKAGKSEACRLSNTSTKKACDPEPEPKTCSCSSSGVACPDFPKVSCPDLITNLKDAISGSDSAEDV